MPQQGHNTATQIMCTATQVNMKNGNVYKVNEGLSSSTTSSLGIASTPTPNFRNVKTFHLPMHNYTQLKRVTQDSLSYVIDYVDPVNYLKGTWNRTFRKEGIDVSYRLQSEDLASRLSNMMLKELSEQKASTLVTLAEINKTADMIANAATSISGFLSGIKKGDLVSALNAVGLSTKKQPKSVISKFARAYRYVDQNRKRYPHKFEEFVSKQWLAYSYGWKPLLSDVHSQAEALASSITEHSDVVRVVKVRNRYDKNKFDRNHFGGNLKGLLLSEETLRQTGQMKVSYMIPNGGVPAWQAFGVVNPLEVAWEVIPYSFVVDWFLPVGEYLKSLTATVGLNFHSGVVTLCEERSLSITAHKSTASVYISGPGYIQTLVSMDGSFIAKDYSMNRTVMSTFPFPQAPSFKDPRSFAHAASAIALLLTVVKR